MLVAHDGADAPDIEPRSDPHRGFHVGYVGHLYPGRGAELILELARRIPEATFHFVGGTNDDIGRLKKQAPTNAIFHGHVPHSETARYYQSFDAALAPYQRRVAVHGGAGDTSAFMSPLKIFEYMAFAKPILCSDHAVLQEVLVDGETAVLLQPDDIEAWEKALRRLMTDPAFAKRLGKLAQTRFKQFYTWQARCKRIVKSLKLDVVA
jgi:glycosyltransferase involved in cell wall biosynthesis